WKPRAIPVSSALAAAVDFAIGAYATGKIDETSPLPAVNLLPDEPAADRNAKLAALKAKLGEVAQTRIEPQHDLAGRSVATCAKGTLTGTITLTPGPRPQIQTFEVEASA